MFTKFIRSFVSVGATTTFEKARLQVTYKGDTEAPSSTQLEVIMQTLGGKDPETRPQVGFSLLVAKLQSSDSLNKWNYIIKNLIILDRCVEEKYFLHDISELDLKHIRNYKDEDIKNTNMLIDKLIQKYYVLIKEKARLYSNKQSCFNVDKLQKSAFFKSLGNQRILNEIESIQYLHEMIIDTISTDQRGYLRYKVNQYVFLLLLYTLMHLYANQYVGIIVSIDKLFTMSLDEARICKTIYSKFLRNTDDLIHFINNHQNIQGFQFSTVEFYKADPRTIRAIDDYIEMLGTRQKESKPPAEYIDLNIDQFDLDENGDLEFIEEKFDEQLDFQRYSQKFETNQPKEEVDWKKDIEEEFHDEVDTENILKKIYTDPKWNAVQDLKPPKGREDFTRSVELSDKGKGLQVRRYESERSSPLKGRLSDEKIYSNEPVLVIGQKEEVIVKIDKGEIEKLIEQELLDSQNRMSMRLLPNEEVETQATNEQTEDDEDEEDKKNSGKIDEDSERIIKKLHKQMARRISYQPKTLEVIGDNGFRIQGSAEDFDNCRTNFIKTSDIDQKVFENFGNTYSGDFKAEKNSEEEEKEKSYIQATAEFTYKYLFWKKSKKPAEEK